jgi:hypothetical protein
MRVVHPVAGKIVASIRAFAGKPVAVSDLLDLGSRPAVKQSLSRLARAGTIQRVGHGLYAWPRYSQLLKEAVPPPVDQLAKAWARRHALRIIPFGAHAANLLGLSTQVPAKYVYYTNGRSRQAVLGGVRVKFLNRGPRTMNVEGELPAMLFQALKYLGAHGVTPQIMSRLRRLLRVRDRADIRRSLGLAPVWMRPILEDLCGRKVR